VFTFPANYGRLAKRNIFPIERNKFSEFERLLHCWVCVVTYCFLSNCQGLPVIPRLQDGHTKEDDCCLGSEVKLPLSRSVQTHVELLTEKRSDGYNCDTGEFCENSIEGSYFENRDPARSNGAKHGFGNAERHVLISLYFSPSCLYFMFS
jgi:hypothetical protein